RDSASLIENRRNLRSKASTDCAPLAVKSDFRRFSFSTSCSLGERDTDVRSVSESGAADEFCGDPSDEYQTRKNYPVIRLTVGNARIMITDHDQYHRHCHERILLRSKFGLCCE